MTRLHYRLFLTAISFIALSGFAATTYAGGYIGVDGSSVNVTDSDEDDINLRGLRLRLGVRVSQTFDLEAHIGGASDNSTRSFDEFSVGYMGVYLKGYLPIGQRSALFGLAGGAAVELEQNIGTGTFSDDRSGFSYGFGLETQLSHSLDLSADYIRYTLDDDDFSDVSAFSLGIKWYF